MISERVPDLSIPLARANKPPHSSTNPFHLAAALIYYGYTNTVDNINTILLDWTIIFSHPIQIGISFILVPFILFFFPIMTGVMFLLRLLGADKALENIGDTVYNGNTLCNWGDPNPLTDIDVEAGFDAMEKPDLSSQFDLTIAKTLLFFSALMYESSDHANIVLNNALKSHDIHISTSVELNKEKRVGEFVEVFSFTSTTSDLKTIIVAIRGTSPFDLGEWLKDADMSKIDGSEYLVGSLHEGLFRSLFLNRRGKTTNPYKKIIRQVNAIAASSADPSKVRVWVTGHSLGAGLATLFFARAVASREITSAKLCGAYTFGCPRVGNLDFRNEHTLRENTPFDNPIRMYRMYNTNDPVPMLPPGFDDPNVLAKSRGPSGQQLLDYIHVGTPIFLHRHPYDFPDQYTPFDVVTLTDLFYYFYTNIIIALNLSSIIDYFLGWWRVLGYFYTFLMAPTDVNFIKWGFEFITQLVVIGNHLPSTYLANLEEQHIQPPNPAVSFH